MLFTASQREIIKDNLKAFSANIKSFKITKADFGRGFYVYIPATNPDYIQYCYNIHYLNGYLYGIVQAIHRREIKENTKGDII